MEEENNLASKANDAEMKKRKALVKELSKSRPKERKAGTGNY
jgi:hypothetical protein